MQVKIIKKIAAERLKGKYFQSLFVIFSCIFVYLSFSFLEYFTEINYVVALLLTVFALIPLLTGSVWWFAKNTAPPTFSEKVDFLQVICDVKLVFRAFLLTFFVLLIQALYSSGIILCVHAAYLIFNYAIDSNNTALFLLIAFNVLLLAVVFFIQSVKTFFGLAALPVLFTFSPFANPVKLILHSLEVMDGHKLNLLFLILSYWYCLPLLPLFLPKIIGGVSIFIHDILTYKPR